MSVQLIPPAYARLPNSLYATLPLAQWDNPALFALNDQLAQTLGLPTEGLRDRATALLSGAETVHNEAPLAMVYSGHQFGQYAGRLGDGRAMLIGEIVDPDGDRHECHLKGSGLTPYSRGGDGKATLGSAIREYLISEAMAGLGVPTSRSLAIVTTGETLQRQNPSPGAILTRTARSHIRVGTFQYIATDLDTETLYALADFAIERLDPDLFDLGEERYLRFMNEVAHRQAKLIANWMSFGFIHGVMNTDNMALSGETIDYGPCAFMDDFHPAKVFSSIDYYGRYAWNKQAEIGLWNLSRLAEAMLPLFGNNEETQIKNAESALSKYPGQFKTAWTDAISRKLGLREGQHDAFITTTLSAFMESKVDFTRVFTALTRHMDSADKGAIIAEFETAQAGEEWLATWQDRTGGRDAISQDAKAVMHALNPVRIARNHQVEAAIAAAEAGQREVFDKLKTALLNPFEEDSRLQSFEQAPSSDEIVHQTFCGT